MNKIICPSCKKEIEISEAVKHQFKEELNKIKIEAEAEKREQIKQAIEEAKLQTQNNLEKKFRSEFEERNKTAQSEIAKSKEKEKALEKRIQELKNKEDNIKQEAVKEVSEKSRLEKLEFEKKINDMQKALEDAQRKGKQGSQQLQGEVMELDLENKLRISFPNDEFLPVPKGVEGGDIWQKVIYKNNVVGSILWETKRAKSWSNSWIFKLKDDSAKITASEAIIASEVLPDKVKDFDRKNGVWITTYEHAISICRYVRFLITTVSTIKSSASQTDEEWTKIRDYIMSDAFKHKMQAHFDVIKALKDGLDADKKFTILKWKKQEAQIQKLDSNSVNFYGELNAILANLPQIKDLDLLPENQLSLED